MSATGEKKWSAKGKEVTKMSFEPLPKGDYEFRVDAGLIEQRVAKDKPGSVPYISIALPALGTAQNGGKDRRVYHRLFLHTVPSEKDGKAMVERQGGVLDLAKALGVEPEFSQISVPYQKYDAKGNKQGGMTKMSILKPSEVVEWLKSFDGTVIKGHVKVDRGNKEYGPKNEVDYFIPSEETDEDEGDEFEQEDEETEEEETEEEASDEEDETPKGKSSKK